MMQEDRQNLAEQLSGVLGGADSMMMTWPENAAGYRVLRWIPDLPLMEEEKTALTVALHEIMTPVGTAGTLFSGEDGDLNILLCHIGFPAKTHRETALWLSVRRLLEFCYLRLEQEGTMYVGEEVILPVLRHESEKTLREVTDWWSAASPIIAGEAFRHRANLQTAIKRRRYASIGGYITRTLRNEPELNRACFGFVPIVIEAIWTQHAELGIDLLTEKLSLNDMARRPEEALHEWIAALQAVLSAEAEQPSAEPIERVINGIRTDCSLPYSQGNLSRSLGLTPAYFCRLFREKTGQHFSAFLTMVRMEKAQALLSADKGMTLQEISQSCGYPNKSYFCQVFRKYTGMTPGEYEQSRKGNASGDDV